LPGNTQLQLAALANNVAGQYFRAGRNEEALAQLRRAEGIARTAKSDHPEFYVSVLQNVAAVHVAMDRPDLADQALLQGVSQLRSTAPDTAPPVIVDGSPTDTGQSMAGLAALKIYLDETAMNIDAGPFRIKSISTPDKGIDFFFTLQLAEVADPEKS
jgi:hypothetical protein